MEDKTVTYKYEFYDNFIGDVIIDGWLYQKTSSSSASSGKNLIGGTFSAGKTYTRTVTSYGDGDGYWSGQTAACTTKVSNIFIIK